MINMMKWNSELGRHESLEEKNLRLMEVGAPATVSGWSDKHPATVVDIFKKGKTTYVTVQQDSATRIDNNGMSDNQEYTYERNTQGSKYTFKVKSDGDLVNVAYNPETKRFREIGGKYLTIGVRRKFHDYSF